MSKQPSCDKNGVAFSSIKSYKIKSGDKGMIDCYYVDNYNYNQFNDDNSYYSLININIIAIISLAYFEDHTFYGICKCENINVVLEYLTILLEYLNIFGTSILTMNNENSRNTVWAVTMNCRSLFPGLSL